MIYAIDFGILKRNEFIIDENLREISNLILNKGDIILIETGCPKGKLYRYSKKCKVLLIEGKDVKKFRKKEKSHKEDALTILKLYEKKPNLFRELTIKDKGELERIKQFKLYMRITKILAGIKSIQKAQIREYGEDSKEIQEQIKSLETTKKEVLKPLKKWIKPYEKKVKDIVGLGGRCLIGILLLAHPKRFHCLSAYLTYCGFKGSCKKTKRYNRNAKHNYYLVVDEIIRNRKMYPNKFGKMYDEFKKNIAEKNKDWTKGKIDGVTINRLSTFVAKEVYSRFK